jgi:dihydropteroate synthase
MGVINVTPNSFSDGGELSTLMSVEKRIRDFGPIDALDIGAESTAPMNDAINPEEEWHRIEPYLDLLKSLNLPVSIDTYHPETIGRIAGIWNSEKIKSPLIWNDVSGKFDDAVKNFLRLSDNFFYVFCHNLAPIRELTGKHMEYVSKSEDEDYLEELAHYFRPYIHQRVIFDPTLGFSKSYEQNWTILNGIGKLQRKVGHDNWLLGFSRKSFLRKKLGIEKLTAENRYQLDLFHIEVLNEIKPSLMGNVWIRTHRPELLGRHIEN